VELYEFHVGDTTACTPSHGNAVAGGNVGVGGIQIDLAGAAGGKHGMLCAYGQHFAAGIVEHVGAQTFTAFDADLSRGDEIDGDMVLHQVDVRMFLDLLRQGFLHRMAGGIGGVDDATVTVATFARQVKAAVVLFTGEWHALGNQPFHGFSSMFGNQAGDLGIAEACSGGQGVLNVRFDGIIAGQHCRYTALCPVA